VAGALARGLRPKEIAAELEIAKSTVSFHLARLDATPARAHQGRRAVCGTLARSGIRASELCDVRIGHVRLHDPAGARFRIADAKTDAGVREVQMSPDLVEELVSHLDRLRRAGGRTDPDAYVFQNARGGRMARQRVADIVCETAELASERVATRGMAPAAARHAAHAAADVHLDRAAGEPLRRAVGHGPGGSRRLEDDPGRLRAASAARQARA
jgi:integrase